MSANYVLLHAIISWYLFLLEIKNLFLYRRNKVIPSSASHLVFIDDILLVYPQDLDLNSITDRLN